MPDLIHLAIPAFIVLMLVEVSVGALRGRQTYERRDTAASLAMGLGNVGINLLSKGVKGVLFFALYEQRLFDLGSGWVVWLVLLFVDDFVYYWNHRVSHEVRFFWAAHVNHHSSQRYNLSTALRQSWTGAFTHLFFYWPLPLLGFDPLMILSVGSLNLLYQFWIHTELVERLPGWFERVFNTPSHHRVHHGTNVQYLDRNHAGIFIVWDRWFGTFEPEGARVVYGLTKNLETYNPVKIAFHEWADMFRDAARATGWRDRLGYVLGPPGWSPDGSRRTARQMRSELLAANEAAA